MDELKIGYYQHSKSGKFYEVIGVARNSESPDEEMVVYKALYSDPKFGNHCLWVRPKKMFLETIILNEKEVPRFKFMGDLSDKR
ncbi:Uncharacterised protein [uncultured archaeon]|nr:Uncharacterised protein [uncultured archaeon]